MLARQPIEKALASADEDLRLKLELAGKLRDFSVTELALPDNGSYRNYVALQREFPVWTVVAAEEFSVEAHRWCYPVIGCAAYRGYFSESAAQRYAESLVQKGLEATVGGAPAYSTLGWFDDPLLPSFMRYGEADLAETLFHELAHQRLYINGNSSFNEAFATVVGEQGAIRWLTMNRPEGVSAYEQRLRVRNEFSALLAEYKEQLAQLYASGKSADQMRIDKKGLFEQLRTDYEVLKKQSWQGVVWFDRWFDIPLNNARLAAFATYRDLVPKFVELLVRCDNNFQQFYAILQGQRKRAEQTEVPQTCEAQ